VNLGGARVVVAGIGVAGYASADGLIEAGARVTILDESATTSHREKAAILETLGATVRLGPGCTQALPGDIDVVVASPSWAPSAPLLEQAAQRGVEVWSDVDAAWHVAEARGGAAARWLVVAGSGASATVAMLASILEAATLPTAIVGRTRPVMEAVLDGCAYDVIVVDASAAQLRWTHAVSPWSAAVVGVGDPAVLARAYHGVQNACVYDVDRPEAELMVEEADVVEGARAIGFTTGVPAPSMMGVVDGLLVDRAFIAQRRDSAVEVAKVADVAPGDMPQALAAAALARSLGVHPRAVGAGLRARPTRPPISPG